MEVICIGRTDYSGVPTIGAVYDVYGMMISAGKVHFLILSELRRHYWEESSIFEIISGTIPPDWYFGLVELGNGAVPFWGFKELFTLPDYYVDLFEVEPYAVKILDVQREEREPDKAIEQFDVVQSRASVPYKYIPMGSEGTVTKISEQKKGACEVAFHRENGSPYPAVEVPFYNLKSATKA